MRKRKAFRNDIFFKFDLENDLLTMILTYNHFGNKFNQLRHPENPAIDTKIIKIGPWTWPKKRVKGVEKFEPYDFLVI